MERLRWRNLSFWERLWIFLVTLLAFFLVFGALHLVGFPWRDPDGARVVTVPSRSR
ncbi:MAG TPA: hypothetical protein VM290_03510 [Gaiellaceae bacterium]|nr:hypothetical protein [Gaiellaceae bacterium]